MKRERYDYDEFEPVIRSDFVPMVKHGCICAILEINGYRCKARQLSCMVCNRSAEASYVAQFKFGKNQRTPGVPHGRGGSRNSF